MADKMKRVYHPTLNAWRDVAPGDVSDWTDAGWKATKPQHIDDSDALPVGEGYVPPQVQVSKDALPQADSPESTPKSK